MTKSPKRKMIIGIMANTTKKSAYQVISDLVNILDKNGFDYLLSKEISGDKKYSTLKLNKNAFLDDDKLSRQCDMIISIGGDGTMLATAFHAQKYDKPVFGINLGKLGFLVDANIDQVERFIKELKSGKYSIEERMVVTGECIGHNVEKLYAINDIVVDKGGWPKMIELTITVDGEYVTTFAADGLIIATPTGSTGYSISVGGPIVSPKTDVITLSPVSPHSLSVRPLVLPSTQEIVVRADSLHKEIHVNCDGQRVFAFPPPLEIKVTKSSRPLKVVHTSFISYFEKLRKKLLWGIDLRKNVIDKEQ
jgi:NAD+ kinase